MHRLAMVQTDCIYEIGKARHNLYTGDAELKFMTSETIYRFILYLLQYIHKITDQVQDK